MNAEQQNRLIEIAKSLSMAADGLEFLVANSSLPHKFETEHQRMELLRIKGRNDLYALLQDLHQPNG